MEKTEQNILRAVKEYAELKELITQYFWKRLGVDEEWDKALPYEPRISSIEIENNIVFVHCWSRACNRGCCGNENYTYEFPISYLWLDQTEILEDMAKRRAEDLKEKYRREEEERERRKKYEEDQERKKLIELKKKYEK